MRFGYGDMFKASRGTLRGGVLYSCMMGDPTLFSRTDFVEAVNIAQPFLEAWSAFAGDEFPNYVAGTWGPRAALDLLARDGRRWFEIANRETLERVPPLRGGDPVLLSHVSMPAPTRGVSVGEIIVACGEPGSEMFLISRGEVEVDAAGRVLATLRDGDFFGEIALLLSERRIATVRAKTPATSSSSSSAFSQILADHEQFARDIRAAARERYGNTTPS